MVPLKGSPDGKRPDRPGRIDGPTRRELLGSFGVLVASVAGCLGSEPTEGDTASPGETPRNDSTDLTPADGTPDENPTPTTDRTSFETEIEDGSLGIDDLDVADYLLYPLSGTHPHVHRRENMQYVIIRATTSFSADTAQERLSLDLDGTAMLQSNRQPVPWSGETVEVAFAVPKDESFDAGHVRFDGTTLHTLAPETIDRLNHPPIFEVGSTSVTPESIQAGEQARAKVQFQLANVGEGSGTFGASLSGNFLSGSKTITATLDPGVQRDVSGTVRMQGEGDEATVRLDWGSDEWTGTVPVVGTTTPE